MSNYEKIDFNELGKVLKDEISIERVHETYSGGYVNKSGTMSECPFCGKKKLYKTPGESFICYGGCNNRGPIDIFTYYQMKFNVDFYVAKISLARDFGHMNQETADRLLRGKSNTVYVPQKQKNYVKPVEKEIIQKQSPEVISNVYNMISKLSPLKKEQFYYLRNIRDLSIERIQADYFNLPYMKGDAGRKFMDKLLIEIKKEFGYEEKDLIGVPGFYMENGRMTFCDKKGIGMKARNTSKLVNGIQIRNYDYIKEDGDLHINNPSYKYLWVTSRDMDKGVPAGAAIDVIMPKNTDYKSVIITEGKFKSEIISRELSCPVISVQGVYQWKNVLEPEVKYICENSEQIGEIVVCFDADMGTNLEVYRELKAMIDNVLCKFGIKVKVGVWDQKFGKGFDDLILSNNKSKALKIGCGKYIQKYENFLVELKKMYDIKNYIVYYKGTQNKVDKDELIKMYDKHVLIPLGIKIAS